MREETERKNERGTERERERAKQQNNRTTEEYWILVSFVVRTRAVKRHHGITTIDLLFIVEGTFLLVVFYKGTQSFTTSRYDESVLQGSIVCQIVNLSNVNGQCQHVTPRQSFALPNFFYKVIFFLHTTISNRTSICKLYLNSTASYTVKSP